MARCDQERRCLAHRSGRRYHFVSPAMSRVAALLTVIITLSVCPGRDLFADSKTRAPLTSSIKGLEMSPQELRIRLRALIRPTLGAIEESADKIMAEASDPVVRREVLVWKIEITTTLLTAMLRTDPVLALADAWGYVIQIEDLIKRPEMRSKYGELAKAKDALANITRLFRDFVSDLWAGPSVPDRMESSLRQWAERHPIEGELYRRPSMDSAVAKMLASSDEGGVFAAIGGLEETAADIIVRMDLYTMYLPRLARWEAGLTADDLMRGVDTRTLSNEFVRLTRAADRIASAAETVSELVLRERTAAMGAVQKERIVVLQEIEAMRKQTIMDTGDRLERVVDHVFFRLVQLLLVCAALAVIGLILRGYMLRRKG